MGSQTTLVTTWRETYAGGSEQAEAAEFAAWAEQIQDIQREHRERSGSAVVRRGFHAKQQAGVEDAELAVDDDLPDQLRTSVFRPGARYAAVVRLSNASGRVQPDSEGDLRGLAVRVDLGAGRAMDLLATNGAVSFARDAGQFMAMARATAGSRLLAVPRLAASVGPLEAVRMLRTALGGTRRPVRSLATERYWSRGAYRYGDGAVRFEFVPTTAAAPAPPPDDPDYLRHELVERLRTGPVSWRLLVQPYRDERSTPIEDASRTWASEPVPVARLTIPRQDLDAPGHAEVERRADAMEFNPWTTVDDHRPLGNINRARKPVYEASQQLRRT